MFSPKCLRRLFYDVLPSDHTCKTSSLGKYYMGNASTTKTGRQCIPWSEVLDERHSDYRFPDDTIRDLSNRCRNPDRKILGPWCYYSTDMDDWDYCDVPLCPGNVSCLCNHTRAFSKLLCYSILCHCLTHWVRDKMDGISQTTFSNVNENAWISLKISLKFVPKVRINNIPALV